MPRTEQKELAEKLADDVMQYCQEPVKEILSAGSDLSLLNGGRLSLPCYVNES